MIWLVRFLLALPICLLFVKLDIFVVFVNVAGSGNSMTLCPFLLRMTYLSLHSDIS